MKRVFRWIGILLLAILIILILIGGSLYALSGTKLGRKHRLAPENELTIASDSLTLARGAQLVAAIPCGQCHGEDLGGAVFADAGPFALLSGPNLTRGRGGRTPPLSEVEWERAIRHGIRRDSTSLIIMPSEIFNRISDQDIAAMISYLKQIPPVDREVPPTKLRIVGRIVLGLGQFKLAADTAPKAPHVARVDAVAGGATYGRYLVQISGCGGCHGASFSGGPGFAAGDPPVSNITPGGIGHYTEADFIRAMREGVRPAGAPIAETMPWRYFAKMSDGELQAIWSFLQTLPAKQFREP